MNLRKARLHQCGLTNLDGLKESEKNENELKKITSSIDSKFSGLNILKGIKAQKSPFQSKLDSTTLLTLKNDKPVLPKLNKSMIKVFEANIDSNKLNEEKQKKRGKSTGKVHHIFPVENSLLGKVDLKQINIIRNAIKLKYGSKDKFNSIFNSYIYDDHEILNYKDVFLIFNKMGVMLSSNEAKIVLENTGKEKVKIEDLTNMIFDPAESIRVKLSNIEQENNPNLLNELEKNSNNFLSKNQEIYIKSQIHRNLFDIIKYFESIDIKKSNFVNFNYFEKALLTRVKLPEKIRGNQDIIKNIYYEFADKENGLFNYKALQENIEQGEYLKNSEPLNNKEAFGITDEKLEIEKEDSHLKNKETISKSLNSKKQLHSKNIQILDHTQLPYNKIESLIQRALKINRKLQQIFQKKEDLEAEIKEKLICDDKGGVNQEQLQNYFINLLKNEINDRKIDKHDLEGFLSSFRYNIHSYTDINKVAEQIFMDDKVLQTKLTLNFRPIPPGNLISTIQSKSNTEGKANNEKLKGLVKDLEYTIFDTNYKIFDVYKKFDVDGDGYVSEKDIKNYLNKINIKFDEPEFGEFIKTLNFGSKGYLDFDSFRQAFGQNMYYKFGTIEKNPSEQIYILPNRNKLINKIDFLKSKKDYKKCDLNKTTYSRFGSTPLDNSFRNFAPVENEFFIAKDRFRRSDLNVHNEYQNEDREKKRISTEAKLKRIQNHHELLLKKILNDEKKFQEIDAKKIERRILNKQDYEERIHKL